MDPKFKIIKDESSEEEKYKVTEIKDDALLESIYDTCEILEDDVIKMNESMPELNLVIIEEDDEDDE